MVKLWFQRVEWPKEWLRLKIGPIFCHEPLSHRLIRSVTGQQPSRHQLSRVATCKKGERAHNLAQTRQPARGSGTQAAPWLGAARIGSRSDPKGVSRAHKQRLSALLVPKVYKKRPKRGSNVRFTVLSQGKKGSHECVRLKWTKLSHLTTYRYRRGLLNIETGSKIDLLSCFGTVIEAS